MKTCANKTCKGLEREGVSTFCSEGCYIKTYTETRVELERLQKEGKFSVALEGLKALMDAMETDGGYPKVGASSLVIEAGIKDYPQAFSPSVRAFFADAKNFFKSTIYLREFDMLTGPGEADYERRVKFYACEYLSALVPSEKLQNGYARLAGVLQELLNEDLLWGYLAAPSSIALVNPESACTDLLPPKSPKFLPSIQSAVFAFVFTKLRHDELKARYPQWVCCEGDTGQPLSLEV